MASEPGTIALTRTTQTLLDELVEKFAIAGTPAEARDQLERLASSGLVDEIAIIPHAHDAADRERIIRLVAEM